jgi:hypothetical protein
MPTGRVGDEDQAKWHYLRALKMQPTLVDAFRGYWYTQDPNVIPPHPVPWIDKALFAFTRLPLLSRKTKIALRHQLLRLHYRRHPEDGRIHFMLGAHAVLLQHLDEAEDRLHFAYELTEGGDFRALARLALVWALRGQVEKARDAVVQVREFPSFVSHGGPTELELAAQFDLLSPLIELPELMEVPGVERYETAVGDAFPNSSDPEYLRAGYNSGLVV